jgi:tetratricopeptide (TPR) repeat protein
LAYGSNFAQKYRSIRSKPGLYPPLFHVFSSSFLGPTPKYHLYFEQALEVNPDNPYALLHLGVILEREENVSEAAAMYQRVIDLNPAEVVAESTRPRGLDLPLAKVAKDNLARLRDSA